MSGLIKKFRGKKEEKVEKPIITEPSVKLDIVNTMHTIMALKISDIAKVYPKNFDMVKHILTEYSALIEKILVFRKTGDPKNLFMKLQEFMIRSVEGYLEKYDDTDNIIDEDQEVLDIVLNAIASIVEEIEKAEGLFEEAIEEEIEPEKEKPPLEDWTTKPKIVKKGGLPSLDTPVHKISGIGEDTAKKLEDIGVKTLEQYVAYQQAQAEAGIENKENEDE